MILREGELFMADGAFALKGGGDPAG